MKLIVLDTNALLRFILNDIPHQKKTIEKVLLQAKQEEIHIIVPQIVIFELHFALDKYYSFSKEDIIFRLKAILAASYLDIQDRDILRTALSLYTQETVSFVDCFLFAKSQMENAELFTFDKKLQKIRI